MVSVPAQRPLTDFPAEIAAWVFDLDNTLYPAADDVFTQVSARIRDYIARFLDLDAIAAHALQKRYFLEYGTSLRGLMLTHRMDPKPFLDYVHDIDLASIRPAPDLDRALGRLDGRKIVFTNASAGHAWRILERLGVAQRFEAVFDIAEADYIPKPEPAPYAQLLTRHGITATGSVMIDDIARNLTPAAALGMTTVWLRNDSEWGRQGFAADDVHFVAEDLAAWLETVRGGGRAMEAPAASLD